MTDTEADEYEAELRKIQEEERKKRGNKGISRKAPE